MTLFKIATATMAAATLLAVFLLGISITHAASVTESLADALLYHSGLAAGHALCRLPEPVVKGGLDGDRSVSGEPPKYDHTRPPVDGLLYNIGDLIGVVGPSVAPKRFRNGGIGGAKEVSGLD
ncbi:hypothetical protein BGW39_010962 [Mortierella sp. 14UC]|nr:hypothetical protein BGW39_010962 [Mortierella sp. 14UC]